MRARRPGRAPAPQGASQSSLAWMDGLGAAHGRQPGLDGLATSMNQVGRAAAAEGACDVAGPACMMRPRRSLAR
jgi:hypothetical protein